MVWFPLIGVMFDAMPPGTLTFSQAVDREDAYLHSLRVMPFRKGTFWLQVARDSGRNSSRSH